MRQIQYTSWNYNVSHVALPIFIFTFPYSSHMLRRTILALIYFMLHLCWLTKKDLIHKALSSVFWRISYLHIPLERNINQLLQLRISVTTYLKLLVQLYMLQLNLSLELLGVYVAKSFLASNAGKRGRVQIIALPCLRVSKKLFMCMVH